MFWTTKTPIYHIASMARSGETILLRCLNRHSKLQVVHNLAEYDAPHEVRLFEFLRHHDSTWIPANHQLLKPYRLAKSQRLILKQAVWKHEHPFNGFILARNPVSCFASLKTYDLKKNPNADWRELWSLNEARIQRWLEAISPEAATELEGKSPIEQFAIFYNARTLQLTSTLKPLIRYEEFVSQPREVLIQICGLLGITFEESMLNPHLESDAAQVGHGQNEIHRPIDDRSLFKYLNDVTQEEFKQLEKLTGSVARLAGYELAWGSTGREEIDARYRKAV